MFDLLFEGDLIFTEFADNWSFRTVIDVLQESLGFKLMMAEATLLFLVELFLC